MSPETPPPIQQGKVRDIYELDEQRIALVASDRLSAFDVIMDEEIPGKGAVLTKLSHFAFDRLAGPLLRLPNHLAPYSDEELPEHLLTAKREGRLTVARRAEMLPIECIVRLHMTGSAWEEYQEFGTVHGMDMPPGIKESQILPDGPMFTPSIKATDGGHDVTISYEEAKALDGMGYLRTRQASQLSRKAFRAMYGLAKFGGFTLADTKLELGIVDGKMVIADEILTPDSSRFWVTEEVKVGETPPSYDKQPVRDYLASLAWDRTPPPPPLPQEIIDETSYRYAEAAWRIMTGSVKPRF